MVTVRELSIFLEVDMTEGLPRLVKTMVVNVQRQGFYRVEYDADSRARILDHLYPRNSVK